MHHITINNETLPIIIRKHPRSRRMVIRYQPLEHHVTLTLPRYASIRQGLHFIEEKRRWIELRMSEHPKHVPFSDGQMIPVLGNDYTLHHTGGRGVIHIDEDKIIVPGEGSFMARRVREWLKKMAREEIATFAQIQSKKLGVRVKKISLRDTTSRWGSCSHDGNLSFSWRLVMAPREVLEYVVCHEVAHLKEHNHGPAFWKVVEELYPGHETARKWLKNQGQTLYMYG